MRRCSLTVYVHMHSASTNYCEVRTAHLLREVELSSRPF
jgi:hypothetical protein